MHVFWNGTDYIVAPTKVDAQHVLTFEYGADMPLGLEQVPDEEVLTLTLDEPGHPREKRTAKMWAAEFKSAGVLASTEY